MAGAGHQYLAVPNVGVGPGPFPGIWVASTISTLTRLGLGPGTTSADRILLLGSATGADPIDAQNPNRLGFFFGDQPNEAPILKHASACPFYAILRYPPLPNTGAPKIGAVFVLQGKP
jgi:hypothetical protein